MIKFAPSIPKQIFIFYFIFLAQSRFRLEPVWPDKNRQMSINVAQK